MNAKTWLNRARNIDREIDGLIKARDETKERVLSITQKLSGDIVQTTKDPHKFDRLVELENEIDKKIDELLLIKNEIEIGISGLKDGIQREVLRLRYLRNKTFEEIAVSTHYSYKQTCRIHGRALLKMEEVLNGRKQGV